MSNKLPKYVLDEFKTVYKVSQEGKRVIFSQSGTNSSIHIDAKDFESALSNAIFFAAPLALEKLLDKAQGEEQELMDSIVECYKQTNLPAHFQSK